MGPRQKIRGLYTITHRESGKRYIGCSVDVELRMKRHQRALSRGEHFNFYLQRAWVRHGPDAFAFELLEVVAPDLPLHRREAEVIKAQRPAYNLWLMEPADAEEYEGYSAEMRMQRVMKISETMKGVTKSAEHRMAISRGRTGKSFPNQNQARRGKPLSEDHRQKIREALTGMPFSEERRIAHGQALKGRSVSEATRRKISEAGKGRHPAFWSPVRREAYEKSKLRRDHASTCNLSSSESL